jgi:hypothetical protein
MDRNEGIEAEQRRSLTGKVDEQCCGLLLEKLIRAFRSAPGLIARHRSGAQ